MDVLHKTLKWVDYNRYHAAWLVVVALVVVSLVGCPSQVASLRDPSIQVDRYALDQEVIATRAELEAEGAAYNVRVKAFNAAVEAKYEELDAKEEAAANAYNFVGDSLIAAGAAAGIPPIAAGGLVGLIGVAGTLFGVAKGRDNKRKDKQIVAIKAA